LRPSGKTAPGRLVARAATLVLGCLGLVWGIYTLPWSEAVDEFQDLESHLLSFETFSQTFLTRTLDSETSRYLNPCDTHSQRAMLLLEMPLADAALRTGAAAEFDRRIRSLESRSREILSCSPRDSFAWLIAFDLEVMHGLLDEHSFNLLAMSYETSPNEAWIAIRRIFVAMPLVLVAPEPVRQKTLHEFQQLIQHGFVDEAARSYLIASGSIRSLLQSRVEQLDLPRQKAFSDTLQKLRS